MSATGGRNGGKLRWRDRPRPSLWGASNMSAIPPIIAAVAWWATAQGLWSTVTGHDAGIGDTPGAPVSRWATLLYSLSTLVVAAAFSVLIWLYLRRPLAKATHVGEGRFSGTAKGYQAEQVDVFFQTIGDRTRAEIRAVGFDLVRPGYDMDAVDKALDQQARTASS